MVWWNRNRDCAGCGFSAGSAGFPTDRALYKPAEAGKFYNPSVVAGNLLALARKYGKKKREAFIKHSHLRFMKSIFPGMCSREKPSMKKK